MIKIKTRFAIPAFDFSLRESFFLTVMYALLTTAFIRPAHYILGGSLNRLWKMYTLAVCGFGVLYFFMMKRGRFQKKEGALVLLIFSFFICFIVSSALNYENSNFQDGVSRMIEIVGYLAVISTGLRYHSKYFLKGYLITGVFWTTIHLITILKYQNHGMRTGINAVMGRQFSDNWFLLTHANASYFIIIPVLTVFFFYAYTYAPKLKIFAWGYLSFAIVCFATQWSVAGLIGFIIFGLFMAFETLTSRIVVSGKKLINRRSKLNVYLIGCLFFNIILTYGQLLKGMLYLFKEYFNKQKSLEDRVTIWTRYMKYMNGNYIFGFGWEKDSVTIYKTTYNHMHNFLLEFLYRGGFMALLPLGFALYICMFHNRKSEMQNQPNYRILSYSAIAFFISANFDYYLYRYELLIIFVMFLYYDDILNDIKARNKKGLLI